MTEYTATKSQKIAALYDFFKSGGIERMTEDDAFAAIYNILNDRSAKEHSEKIRSRLKTQGEEGGRLTTNPIYGYAVDPGDKRKWVIDPEAAAVVRRIYQMYVEGTRIYHIVKALGEEKILSPSAYMVAKGVGKFRNANIANPYKWNATTVMNMIEMPEYAGHTVNFKTYKTSYKTAAKKIAPIENWAIFKNTQEAIIDEETWEMAQTLRKTNRRAAATASASHTSVIQSNS